MTFVFSLNNSSIRIGDFGDEIEWHKFLSLACTALEKVCLFVKVCPKFSQLAISWWLFATFHCLVDAVGQ